MSIFDKWNESIDTKGLEADVLAAAENGGDFEEVPHGTYEVAVSKMELKESKKGNPMLSVWFKIVDGPRKNSIIFYNQVITQGFQIHLANELMKSLDSGVTVEFHDYVQYNEVVQDVFEAVSGRFEYALDYGENAKGYSTYKITEIFEA